MTEAAVGARGEGWRGRVVCISGEDDYQALPMGPGVLTHCRVPMLSSKGHSCYSQGQLERGSVSLFGMYCGCQPERSQLGCAWPLCSRYLAPPPETQSKGSSNHRLKSLLAFKTIFSFFF